LPATTEFRVEGSPLVYTGDQLNKMEDPVDWLPAEHPAMPGLVAHGDHERKLEACGGCHGMNGQGALEIPNLAGLPAAYIVEQLREMAAGRRHSSIPDRPTAAFMAMMAGKLSEAEIADAANFFSSITKRPRWVRVVETDQVPATRAHFHGWLELTGGGNEPLGRRVVEVAEDFNQQWIGDPHSGIVAYVPPGVRIPIIPARDSGLIPATHFDPFPAT
jgi:cytochrome c553